MPMSAVGDVFLVRLDDLQPSQLYINAEKLAAVMSATDGIAASIEPLPVRKWGNRLILTDGHTRAVAAHTRGIGEVPVMYDNDDLDWEAYEICVEWCLREGIRGIADLALRTVSAVDYDRLWLQRCAALHRSLAARRAKEGDDSHHKS